MLNRFVRNVAIASIYVYMYVHVLYRPPSGGLLVPGQVTVPQGARLPTPVLSGAVTLPPPVPPSSVTSSQDTPPPRFPPTQPGAHDCWLIMVG